ncbi:hypothetical protein EDB80DRAFT_875949 [Ilyonectria destructans]|nr:hypothetical protein EDB80DRAFT_875949 [Ilyonectria destructans]
MDASQLLTKAIAGHDPKGQATTSGLFKALAVTLAFALHLYGAKCNFLVIQSQVGGVDRKRLASQLVHKYDYITIIVADLGKKDDRELYLQVVGIDYTGVRTLAGRGADQYQGQGSYGQELGSQDVHLNSSWYSWRANPARGEGNGGPGETPPGDEPPNEDDDKDVNDDGLKSKLQLACHFYKFDPHEYAQCRHAKIRSVADIRQHIIRAHRKPPHCPNCKTIFRGRIDARLTQQRNNHIRAGRCEQRGDDIPGITEEQVQQIKDNGDPGHRRQKAVDSWLGLWRIVFPSANPPKSPYLGGDFQFGDEWIPEAFAAFRASGRGRGLEGAALISDLERFLRTRAVDSRAQLDSISAPVPQADPALPAPTRSTEIFGPPSRPPSFSFPVLDYSSNGPTRGNAFQPSTLQFPNQEGPFQGHLQHFDFSGGPPPPFVHAGIPLGLNPLPTGGGCADGRCACAFVSLNEVCPQEICKETCQEICKKDVFFKMVFLQSMGFHVIFLKVMALREIFMQVFLNRQT